MIWGMLRDLAKHGHDMLPTQRNVDWMWENVCVPGKDNSDPVLVACNGSDLIGLIIWTVPEAGFDMQKRRAVGWGTYVDPQHRLNGVCRDLRRAAMKILRARGIEEVWGTVMPTNTPGASSATRLRGVLHSTNFVYPVEG